VRVAAVDLGTNSTRLLVADVNGALEEVVRRLVITRLGEGVDERRRLLPLPMARVRNVLSDYRRELESLGAERTLCIATSAVRDAENGEAFLGEIEWSYGFTTRLLSGDEEAEMTLRGIGAVEPGTLVVDIGGGSTELQVAGTDIRTSLDVGCVRLTERFGDDVDGVRAYVRTLLPDARVTRAVGVAGTVTTIAALDLGLTEYEPERTHGHVISRRAAEEQTARLAALTVEQRAEIVEPGRAPVIVAGAAILTEILSFYGLAGIEASERDILHGAALAAAELPEPEEGAAPPGAFTCC
jgi:exopolyphosphatase / guanosine-5'-triphosphate,3'-diphosphate pyrophosphatase